MRRVRRKGANKEKVFGCDLLEHLNASSQEIPLVLRSCSEFVETHGIVDGIYRLSGVSSNIQKLRGEFESDGSPELNKDLFLQDIHCVSSLCKAYFRELPNPLLTYQLYDKFAEAVAIQLEEERLVKIRDVLKELPRPHYRTLEFLMRHLVRMASYSSETNMHARNLAIVWAPNLLRSKDIEASGFNGTAAFMEVRVQSIVVEFILTHVPQLFPEAGDSNERRKSLPSPTAACVPEESFFRSQPVPNFGNISPGDGPLAIRPYHAIIEGTDKRKGSLKGRKWMSIFNIGGRFPDPRRRHKHSAKEKERQVLRPARSMDSLSTPPYPNEGCRRPAQRPPSNNIPTPSPLITSSPKPGLDVTVSTGALGGSEYAVTYRRGTGLVSGGTQGTYTALDPEGLGLTGNETLQSRSPGISTKVGRRAAMHITGPTMVTVPLHITSNLALGVLQGGGGDRIIHRGRDKDGGDRVEGKEGGEKVERRESRVIEKKVEESKQVEEEQEEEEEINHREKVLDAEETTVPDDGGEEGGEEKKEDEEELVTGGRGVSREERIRSFSASNTDEDNEEDAVISDYMDMKGMQPVDFQPEVTDHDDDGVYDSFNVLSSTEVEGDDLALSGYVQDNFDFLDQMDCSAMDHMDCSVPCQVNEFSVEPPGHSDDEYEVMEQAQTSCQPAEVQTHVQPDPETRTRSQTELNPHRPLSLDINSRHTKSLSLPYMTSPVHGPEDSSSEDEVEGDDSDENYYSSDDDNDSMFVKSLPSDFFLSNLPDFKPDTDEQDCCAHDGVPACQFQSCEERECQPQNHEFPACEESHEGEEEQIEVRDKVDEDGREEKEITKTEEEDNAYQEGDQLENNKQSKPTEEDCSVMEDTQSDKEQRISSEASTHCCAEFPPPSDDESSTMTYTTVEEEKEVVDNPYRDYLPCQAVSSVTQRESADVLSEESRDFSAGATEQPGICVREDAMEKDSDEGDGWRVCKEIDDMCQEMGQEMKEDDWEVCEETAEEEIKPEETMQGVGKEQDGAICGTSNDIGDELEDEEEAQVEKKGARESVREGDGMEDVKVAEEKEEEEEQLEKISEEMVEDGEGGSKEAEVRTEVVEDSMETSEEKLTDTEMQREFEEKETKLPNTSEQDEAIQRQRATNDKTQRLHREEVVSKEKENNGERAGEHNTKPSVDKQVKEVRSDKKEEGRKYEENDSSQGGVGRKLVVSKNPKVYQVKAVPVVPPKPQHCKITALTLRQQQQQRERRDAGSVGTTLSVPAEQDKVSAGGEQGRDGDRDGERERRREGDEGAASRNSPQSMCFDEAVAIATLRREKEKGCEKEKERQRDRGNEVQ